MDELRSIEGEVTDVRVLPNGTVQVKVAHKGRLVGRRTIDESVRAETINPEELNYKMVKVDQMSQSLLKAAFGYSALIGSKDNRIMSTEKYGNIIVGATSFTAHPENIRFGGVFRLNGLLTSTMPSTIITPISTFVLDVPAEDTIKAVKSIIQEFQEELSALV